MPLKRYRRGASFSYLLFSLTHYGLRAVSNLLNRRITFFVVEIFAFFCTVFTLVFEQFPEMRRVIRHWKSMNKVLLSYVKMVSRFLTVLS